MLINQQTLIILIACVLVLWWTTDYTTCDRREELYDPFPRDTTEQMHLNEMDNSDNHKGENPVVKDTKMVVNNSKIGVNDDIKQQKIKGILYYI